MNYTIYHESALETLSRVKPSTVDVAYLDPPFYTQVDFSDFSDKWESKNDYLSFIEKVLRGILPTLKNTGCLFFHCDYHAEYEIESLIDIIFGENNIANKIYTLRAPKNTKNVVKRLRQNTDTIFFVWKDIEKGKIYDPPVKPVDNTDRWASMTGGGPGPSMMFGNKEISPPDGRHFMWSQDHIDEEWNKGNIRISKNGNPMYKVLSETLVCGNLWDDIPAYSHSWDYSTEKHSSLLERIICMGSPIGGLVLDPMCGSGTAAEAAVRLNRVFVGGDINEKAVAITYKRLEDLDPAEYNSDFEL